MRKWNVDMSNPKPYKGLGMNGVIATWYARNNGRDLSRFADAARLVANRARPSSDVLEVAPGPGYLAIELARRGYRVTAVDISASFVRIARDNAAKAGVAIDVRQGNASALPFKDGTFDFVICTAAFKNFSDPVGALDEMHRVLRADGQAVILDLRKDATIVDIDAEVRKMRLSWWNALMTRWTFRCLLLKRAYTREELEHLTRQSRFRQGDLVSTGIAFELRLCK
jgi:ubiquinone/menaquinone biosynthesis C-methylase UbiE